VRGTPWGACSMSAMIVPLVRVKAGWSPICSARPPLMPMARRSAGPKAAEEGGQQVVSFAVLGIRPTWVHADSPDLVAARRSQSNLVQAGLELAASYLSLTEVSEYAKVCPPTVSMHVSTPSCRRTAKERFAFTPCPNGATVMTTGTGLTTKLA